MILGLIQVIQDAINEIIAKYKGMMMTISRNIVKDEQLAEDVVQEALIRINKNVDKIDNVNSDQTVNYIITITRNAAFTQYKRQKKSDENVQFVSDDEFNKIEGELDIDIFKNDYGFSDDIIEILRGLNGTDRDIITMRYGSGYSLKEIAKIIGMSEDSVYKRCQRALKKLEKILLQEGGTHDE